MVEPMTGKQILALPMERNDSGATTISGYLVALLQELWKEQEGFSGKRPFGNSDWDADIVFALIKAGAVKGEVDDDLSVFDYDSQEEVNSVMKKAIAALGETDTPPIKIRTHILLRSDDNGHTFIVLESQDEDLVKVKQASLLRGHKQHYTLHVYDTQSERAAIISKFSIQE